VTPEQSRRVFIPRLCESAGGRLDFLRGDLHLRVDSSRYELAVEIGRWLTHLLAAMNIPM
jgi:hypothetical protein